MGTLEVRRADDPVEREEWDHRLAEGGGLLFSQTSWAETLSSVSGAPWSLRTCRLGETLVGGALLLEGRAGGGPPAWPPEAPLFSLHVFHREELSSTRRIPQGVEVLSAIARSLAENPGDLACDTPPELLDLRPLSWAGWRVEPRFGFSLPLPGGPPEASVHLEETPPPPSDALSTGSVERGIGSHRAVLFPSGERARLLVLRDEKRLYPLLREAPAGSPARSARLAAASAVGGLPEAAGREEALFFGSGWEEWFGYEAVGPLRIVPTARAFLRGGRS